MSVFRIGLGKKLGMKSEQGKQSEDKVWVIARLRRGVSSILGSYTARLPGLYVCAHAAGLQARRGSQTVVKVLSVSRSNNVSIMLTQFAQFAAGGPLALRAALLAGSADLGVERLSLLLQASSSADFVAALMT